MSVFCLPSDVLRLLTTPTVIYAVSQFHCGGPASRQSLRREDATAGGCHPKVMPPPGGLAPSVFPQFMPLVMVISPAFRHPENPRKDPGLDLGAFIYNKKRLGA